MVDPRPIATAPGVMVHALPALRIEIFRTRASHDTVVAGLAGLFALPPSDIGANRAAGLAPRIIHLSDGEWMLAGGQWSSDDVVAIADDASWHLADVSEGRARFAVHGPAAGDLLSKGCTIDLHHRSFGRDRCAQTLFAQTRALIERVGEDDHFHLYADISVRDHLERWFEDAVVEFRNEGRAR